MSFAAAFVGIIVFILAPTTFAGQSLPDNAASSYAQFIPCNQDPARYKAASAELQKLMDEDQADRQLPPDKIDWSKVWPRDEARREQVAQIFADGCFKTTDDYYAAALVYQHGTVPDHYFQTFLWAKRAYELGDQKAKQLMADGIDRYLVHSGYKQLFATQAAKSTGSPCWCLNQVEATFPEQRRVEFASKSLDQALAWVDSLNIDHTSCKPAKFCDDHAKDSPAGTVPGFW